MQIVVDAAFHSACLRLRHFVEEESAEILVSTLAQLMEMSVTEVKRH